MSHSDAAATDLCVTQCAGEYFLSESAKLDRAREERKAKQEEALGAKAKQVCGVLLPGAFVAHGMVSASAGVCGAE